MEILRYRNQLVTWDETQEVHCLIHLHPPFHLSRNQVVELH